MRLFASERNDRRRDVKESEDRIDSREGELGGRSSGSQTLSAGPVVQTDPREVGAKCEVQVIRPRCESWLGVHLEFIRELISEEFVRIAAFAKQHTGLHRILAIFRGSSNNAISSPLSTTNRHPPSTCETPKV